MAITPPSKQAEQITPYNLQQDLEEMDHSSRPTPKTPRKEPSSHKPMKEDRAMIKSHSKPKFPLETRKTRLGQIIR